MQVTKSRHQKYYVSDKLALIQKHEEGRFGEVWKGHLRGTELVAVKFPKLDRTTITEFLHESQIMKILQHPYVITLCGVCSKGEPAYIITEFIKHGNLLKYLRGEGRSTAIPQLTAMVVQACSGMSYLKQCNIGHRDLAARNILVWLKRWTVAHTWNLQEHSSL